MIIWNIFFFMTHKSFPQLHLAGKYCEEQISLNHKNCLKGTFLYLQMSSKYWYCVTVDCTTQFRETVIFYDKPKYEQFSDFNIAKSSVSFIDCFYTMQWHENCFISFYVNFQIMNNCDQFTFTYINTSYIFVNCRSLQFYHALFGNVFFKYFKCYISLQDG